MGTVNLTDDLKNHILEDVNKLFKARLDAQVNRFSTVAIQERIYIAVLGSEKVAQTLRALPADWFWTENEMRYSVKFKKGDAFETLGVAAAMPASGFPLTRVALSNAAFNRYGTDIPLLDPYASGSAYVDLKPIADKFGAIVLEQEQLTETIKGTMDQCKTLNQLVKIWPTAVEHVTDEVKQRLYSKRAAAGERFDPNAVVMSDDARALLLKARLINQAKAETTV